MDENTQTNKKNLWISVVVIVIIALGVAGYYFYSKKMAKPIVWDGSYKMVGNLACKGNFPNLTTIPMDTTFTVSSNNIMEPSISKSFAIDKKGKSTEAFQQTQSGVTTDVKADYQFLDEGGLHKFTAEGVVTLSTVKSGKTLSSVCSGTISGAKQ